MLGVGLGLAEITTSKNNSWPGIRVGELLGLAEGSMLIAHVPEFTEGSGLGEADGLLDGEGLALDDELLDEDDAF